jgi:hypothetical protein
MIWLPEQARVSKQTKHNIKIQEDQKVSVHLMITVQKKNTQKYFKQFQSLTMIT